MEVAGLVFGALGALETCLRVSKEVNGFIRQFKAVNLDFEWASNRLDIHKAEFETWIDFWDIKEDTPTETFHILWGPVGTATIKTHLEGIRGLCTKATESQAKYKRALGKASRPTKFRLFREKFRYTFSGKQEFEEDLNRVRSEFHLVTQGAERFFMGRNHDVTIGSISKARIRSLVKESALIDRVVSIQQTSMELFNGLEAHELQLNLDLALQPDYVSRYQFRELDFDVQRLQKKSAKLPIVVNTPSKESHFSPHSIFVLEAGEEISFEAPAKKLRVGDLNFIVLSTVPNQLGQCSSESFFLRTAYERYRFLVHSTGLSSLRSNSVRLEELFDNRPRRADEPPSRSGFAITWQFDLAYTLAISVLNLQGSGWLHALHSRNIYQRQSFPKSAMHSVKVCGNDIFAPEETPLDKIYRKSGNSYLLKPEIFRLGVLLLEIGLARSVPVIFRDLEDDTNKRTPEEKLDQIFNELDYAVCPIYTDVTRACLEGDFDFGEDMDGVEIMRSYISTVLEPLRIQCESMNRNQAPRRRRGSNSSTQLLAPKAINNNVGIKGKNTLSPISDHKVIIST